MAEQHLGQIKMPLCRCAFNTVGSPIFGRERKRHVQGLLGFLEATDFAVVLAQRRVLRRHVARVQSAGALGALDQGESLRQDLDITSGKFERAKQIDFANRSASW